MVRSPNLFILSLPVICIVLGIVFIITGILYDDNILMYMGFGWFPSGIISLGIVLYFIRKGTR